MSLRHDRRRRLLADESPGEASEDAPLRIASSSPDGESAAYAPAARAERDGYLHDVIPSRSGPILLALAVGTVLVALLEVCDLCAPSLGGILSAEDCRALHWDGARNLSDWLAAMLLGSASLVAMFVYSLRRHRVDDYHGRYRIWIPLSVICLVASVVETTDAHQIARAFCRRGAELCGLSESKLWSATIATMLSLVGVRLFIEVRRSRWAVAMLLLCAGTFLTAAAAGAGWLSIAEPWVRGVQRGGWLLGYVSLVGTFLAYARCVLLEIEGRGAGAPTRRKKPKPKSSKTRPDAESEAAKGPALHVRTDLDQVEKTVAARPSAATTTPRPAAPVASAKASEPDEEASGLSRAERRRARRQMKMAG